MRQFLLYTQSFFEEPYSFYEDALGHHTPFNAINMFGLFKKKTEQEKLQERYQKLMGEAHKLSHSNRRASDEKVAEAEEVMKQLEALRKS